MLKRVNVTSSIKGHLRQTSDFIVWLYPCAGNRNQILPCNWLPERARWSYLARSGLPAVYREKYFPESQISPLFIKPSNLAINIVYERQQK